MGALLTGSNLRSARAALDALSRRFLRHAATERDPSLAGGNSGIALAHAALDVVFPRRGHAAIAERALERAMSALARRSLTPSLYTGLTGIAWAIEILGAAPDDSHDTDQEDSLTPIDAALGSYLARSEANHPWSEPYDLIHGLVGIGVYALERLPRARAKSLVREIVTRLAETAQRRRPGVAWWSDPAWTPKKFRQSPHPAWNLGVAHGVPGVIALLGRIVAADIDARTTKRAHTLLHKAVDWLLGQQLPATSDACFPRSIDEDATPGPAARLAWCYGDPGIAATLLVAARGAKEPAWERAAHRIALRAAARPLETAGIVDAGLCHGAAGVAHIFHRLHRATGDARLADAARFWFEKTLALRDPRRGFAGFRARLPGAGARGRASWQSDPGFLTGAAGVTLALVAATTGADPIWDRALLLS